MGRRSDFRRYGPSPEMKHAVWKAGRPQVELAALIGMHRSILNGWLTGRLRLELGDDRIHKLASILGVPPGQVFDETEMSRRSIGGAA